MSDIVDETLIYPWHEADQELKDFLLEMSDNLDLDLTVATDRCCLGGYLRGQIDEVVNPELYLRATEDLNIPRWQKEWTRVSK